MAKSWYLLKCHVGKIDIARKRLENMGVECFSPELGSHDLEKLFRTRRKHSTTRRSIFPPYLFVRFSIVDISISKINYVIGVNCFVRFGGNIMPLPQSIVENIIESKYIVEWDKEMFKFLRCNDHNIRCYALLSMIERELGI